MDIEITVWSVNATTPSESVARVAETGGEGAALTSSSREVFDAASAAFVSANIFQRDDMQAGARVQGPIPAGRNRQEQSAE